MIRHFLPTDFEAIYSLGTELTNTFVKTNNLEEIYKDPLTKILVYVEKSKVIGFLMYIELTESVDIFYVIVQKENRGRKIASCLLDYMISGLKDSIQLITLEVKNSNTPAINLYKKFGFEISTIRKKYYADGEDGYLMGRVIKK